jgi:hypothetical protein
MTSFFFQRFAPPFVYRVAYRVAALSTSQSLAAISISIRASLKMTRVSFGKPE